MSFYHAIHSYRFKPVHSPLCGHVSTLHTNILRMLDNSSLSQNIFQSLRHYLNYICYHEGSRITKQFNVPYLELETNEKSLKIMFEVTPTMNLLMLSLTLPSCWRIHIGLWWFCIFDISRERNLVAQQLASFARTMAVGQKIHHKPPPCAQLDFGVFIIFLPLSMLLMLCF